MSACEEEPCKSLIDEFWGHAIAASKAQLRVRLHCDVRKVVIRDYIILFSLWAAVFASALACHALLLPPFLCTALTVAALLLLGALFVWGVRLAILDRITRRHQEICREHYHAMLSARRSIAVRCPRECQPQKVEIKCDC